MSLDGYRYRLCEGFLCDEEFFAERTDLSPEQVAEQRTLVMHNLEVYWPPVGELIRHVVRFFHAYTQVNLYMSPPGLAVATAPHQDAHSVFIVQTHGRKRWCVHAPRAPLTIKAFQRGKNGEVIDPADRTTMGRPLLNVTLRPGQVLYVPRAFFHHSSTAPAAIVAEDVDGGGGSSDGSEDATLEGQPSMALTISILNEDVRAGRPRSGDLRLITSFARSVNLKFAGSRLASAGLHHLALHTWRSPARAAP